MRYLHCCLSSFNLAKISFLSSETERCSARYYDFRSSSIEQIKPLSSSKTEYAGLTNIGQCPTRSWIKSGKLKSSSSAVVDIDVNRYFPCF
ncbi:hypothetical protein CS542_09815 [Pedobacter sp. IW39]|nr:hypothetical protein CS542_09815 [Pedobacter sp. IW39]